jgi:hypothetical protein
MYRNEDGSFKMSEAQKNRLWISFLSGLMFSIGTISGFALVLMILYIVTEI